jgi:AcrR family transcriptional regulator
MPSSPAPDTTDRLIEAAKRLFAERGYVGATTRAIAEAAAVNEATLFRRFGSKQGLLRAIAARLAERQAGPNASSFEREGVRDALRALAEQEVRSAMSDGVLALRLTFDARGEPDVAEVVGDGVARNLRAFTEFLADRQAQGELRADLDPETMAHAFFGMTSSFVMVRVAFARDPLEDDDVVGVVDQLVTLFWSGVAPRAREGADA